MVYMSGRIAVVAAGIAAVIVLAQDITAHAAGGVCKVGNGHPPACIDMSCTALGGGPAVAPPVWMRRILRHPGGFGFVIAPESRSHDGTHGGH